MYPEGKASGEYNSKIFEVHLLVPEGDLSDPDGPFRRSIGSGSLDVAPYVSMERRPIPATVKLNVAMANGKEVGKTRLTLASTRGGRDVVSS